MKTTPGFGVEEVVKQVPLIFLFAGFLLDSRLKSSKSHGAVVMAITRDWTLEIFPTYGPNTLS